MEKKISQEFLDVLNDLNILAHQDYSNLVINHPLYFSTLDELKNIVVAVVGKKTTYIPTQTINFLGENSLLTKNIDLRTYGLDYNFVHNDVINYEYTLPYGIEANKLKQTKIKFYGENIKNLLHFTHNLPGRTKFNLQLVTFEPNKPILLHGIFSLKPKIVTLNTVGLNTSSFQQVKVIAPIIEFKDDKEWFMGINYPFKTWKNSLNSNINHTLTPVDFSYHYNNTHLALYQQHLLQTIHYTNDLAVDSTPIEDEKVIEEVVNSSENEVVNENLYESISYVNQPLPTIYTKTYVPFKFKQWLNLVKTNYFMYFIALIGVFSLIVAILIEVINALQVGTYLYFANSHYLWLTPAVCLGLWLVWNVILYSLISSKQITNLLLQKQIMEWIRKNCYLIHSIKHTNTLINQLNLINISNQNVKIISKVVL